MGQRHRRPRATHTAEEHQILRRGTVDYLLEPHTRLETPATVRLEIQPRLRDGDDFAHVAQELASIAHAERKFVVVVVAREEQTNQRAPRRTGMSRVPTLRPRRGRHRTRNPRHVASPRNSVRSTVPFGSEYRLVTNRS